MAPGADGQHALVFSFNSFVGLVVATAVQAVVSATTNGATSKYALAWLS